MQKEKNEAQYWTLYAQIKATFLLQFLSDLLPLVLKILFFKMKLCRFEDSLSLNKYEINLLTPIYSKLGK